MFRPRTQAWRLVARRLPYAWRAKSTGYQIDPDQSNASENPSPDSEHLHKDSRRRIDLPMLKSAEKRSAYIRTSNFIQSLADAFAIIRAVEHKYGTINHYQFVRDFEVRTEYQLVVHIVFRDSESLHRIPAVGDILHIPAPPTITDRPGGIGLDELEGLLERQERDEETTIPAFKNVMSSVLQSENDPKKDVRMIDCKIERSNTEYYTPSRLPLSGPSRFYRESAARNFINWGGFHEFKPLDRNTPIPDEELFGPTSIDHLRMRRVLRKWTDTISVPNPYEYTKDSEPPLRIPPLSQQENTPLPKVQWSQASGQEDMPAIGGNSPDWEPLPGSELSTEDIPTPSTVETAPSPQHSLREASSTPSPLTSPSPPSDTSTSNTATVAPSSSPDPQRPMALSTSPSLPLSNFQGTAESSSRKESISVTQQATRPRKKGHANETQKATAISSKAAQKPAKKTQQEHKKPKPSKPKGAIAGNKPAALSPRKEQQEVRDTGIAGRLKNFIGGWF